MWFLKAVARGNAGKTLDGNGCLAVIIVIALVWVISAFWWGWLFMVITGACGWHIPYFPTGVAFGFLLSMVLG